MNMHLVIEFTTPRPLLKEEKENVAITVEEPDATDAAGEAFDVMARVRSALPALNPYAVRSVALTVTRVTVTS